MLTAILEVMATLVSVAVVVGILVITMVLGAMEA